MGEPMKVCPACVTAKPARAFALRRDSGRGNRQSHCKACEARRQRVRQRAYRALAAKHPHDFDYLLRKEQRKEGIK